MTGVSGWGSLPWGAGPWGAGGGAELAIVGVLAVRENVARIFFNVAPLFNRLLSPNDASNPKRFRFVAQALPLGNDGEPARAVLPVRVDRPKIANSLGTILDVTLDRPMSPWPARYLVSVNQLVSADGSLLAVGGTSMMMEAVYRTLRPQSTSDPSPSRDIANPQTYSAQLDPLPQAGDPLALGVIPIDASGDYAFDQGITQLKKRIFRRLLTPRGSFLALPEYGVGIGLYGKQLSVEAVRQQICEEAQKQIAQEPDVAAVRVTALTDLTNPAVTIFRIKVRVSGSQGITQFDIPFAPV